MNNSKTPKIVVAVGLAAVYASGMAYLVLSDKPQAAVAHNAAVTAPGAQMAAEHTPTPAIAPTPAVAEAATEASTSVAEQQAATTTAVDPVASVASRTQRNEQMVVREQAARQPAVAPPMGEESPEARDPVMASNEPARVSEEALPAEQVESAVPGNDSQITDEVKTQIAAVVPAGTIDVTTRDGVVELAGSVPSEEQIEKVWLAARNVPAVRDVDVSALMISN